MTQRRVPIDPAVIEEVPEADVVEQQTDVIDVTDPVEGDDADRVVAVDEDEYR